MPLFRNQPAYLVILSLTNLLQVKSLLILPETADLRPQQIIYDYHLSYMVFLFPPPTRKFDITVLKDKGEKKKTMSAWLCFEGLTPSPAFWKACSPAFIRTCRITDLDRASTSIKQKFALKFCSIIDNFCDYLPQQFKTDSSAAAKNKKSHLNAENKHEMSS